MSFSRHNFLQIFLALESGKRRGAWVRQALVSKVYPYFEKPESTFISAALLSGGVLSEPYLESTGITATLLSGGSFVVITNPDYDQTEPESLSIASLLLNGGVLRLTRVDYEQLDIEVISFITSQLLSGGALTDVAVRTSIDTDSLTISSSLLNGGTLGT